MTVIRCMVPEIWSAKDGIFCHFDHFLSFFYPLNNPKDQSFEKLKKKTTTTKKKHWEILSFYTCVTQIAIIWCMVQRRGQIFLSFWTVFCPLTLPPSLMRQKIKTLKKWAHTTEFFVNLDHLLPFYPSYKLKIQNFEKLKKSSQDVIILLLKCTKNQDDMLLFWAIFCPFTPNNPENEN